MAQAPITTIVPFANTAELPACAVSCGPLYDANGACVPPAIPTNNPAVYTSCFCLDSRVAAFSTTTGGVCDTACTADPNGLSSITSWFHSICDVQNEVAPTTTTTSTPGSTIPPTNDGSTGGDWISTHWKWVIMLVVLVVAIAGIWIGACIWRRRYLRKRDLQRRSNGPNSWTPTVPPSESAAGIPMTYNNKNTNDAAANANANAGQSPPLPTFVSAADEKRKSKGKKKWIINDRT